MVVGFSPARISPFADDDDDDDDDTSFPAVISFFLNKYFVNFMYFLLG